MVEWGIASGDSMSFVAGFVDYDGDADPDFFVTNHWKSEAEFYRNEGGALFVEKSDHFVAPDRDRHDMLWGDLDNDGDPDQYIVHGAGLPGTHDNELYWNEGHGVLTEGGVAAGVADPDGRGREVTFADFNGDHWLDMFVVNDLRAGFVRPSVLFWNQGDGTFLRQPNTSLIFRSRQHVASADYDVDGDVDIITTDPPRWGEFWRNDGSGWT
ncbi:MAG: FG-GAP repeat domain-containing protein, partial [bacterium]